MLHIFVLSYTYKIVSITSGIYLKTSKTKKNCLVFLFRSSYLSILVKILLKITIELSYNREVYVFPYLFLHQVNIQHPCLYRKNEEQTEQIWWIELSFIFSCIQVPIPHFSSFQLICHFPYTGWVQLWVQPGDSLFNSMLH